MNNTGPDIAYCKTRLPSGLNVVSEYLPYARSAVIGLWINAGSRDEKEKESGLAHLVEHLLFKGTVSRSASDIARQVDAMGGQLDAFTSRELTCLYLSVLEDRVEKGGELLADIYLNSSFEEKELELERGVVLEEIKMSRDNPEDLLHDLLMAHVWSGHPISRPILGTPESVLAFGRRDIRRFFGNHYHLNKTVLAAAGRIEHEDLCRMASHWFGGAPKEKAGNERRSPEFRPGVIRQEKDLHQTYLDINLPGIPQADELRYAAHILNTVLGGSISSRLFQRIREERGLAYSIYSGLSSHMDSGLLHISASTSPNLAATVAELIIAELDNLRRELPTKEEIRRAKDHLTGSLVLSMENTSTRMTKLGKEFFYYDKHVAVDDSIAQIEAVDDNLLSEVSGRFFNGGLAAFGFLGPGEGLPDDGEIPSW